MGLSVTCTIRQPVLHARLTLASKLAMLITPPLNHQQNNLIVLRDKGKENNSHSSSVCHWAVLAPKGGNGVGAGSRSAAVPALLHQAEVLPALGLLRAAMGKALTHIYLFFFPWLA